MSDHPTYINALAIARESGSFADVVEGRVSSSQPRNRTYDLKLHGPRGFVTLSGCRFDAPERTIARAIDALGTMEAFVSSVRELVEEAR